MKRIDYKRYFVGLHNGREKEVSEQDFMKALKNITKEESDRLNSGKIVYRDEIYFYVKEDYKFESVPKKKGTCLSLLKLSPRVYNSLLRQGFEFIEDLEECEEDRLYRLRDIGAKAREEIKTKLYEYREETEHKQDGKKWYKILGVHLSNIQIARIQCEEIKQLNARTLYADGTKMVFLTDIKYKEDTEVKR